MRSALPFLFTALAFTAACSNDDDPVTPSTIAVAVGQTSGTIVQGGSITVPITLTRTNYGSSVNLTAEGLPTGVTAAFNPQTVTGTSSTSAVTFTANNTATAGTANVTIRAAGSNVSSASSTIALTINAAAGVTLGSGATTAVAAQGGAASLPVFITRNGTFTGPVTLAIEGLPTGVTGTFSSPTLGAGSRVATLSLNAAANAVAGTTPITIRATGAGIQDQTQVVNFTVNPSTTAGFGVSATPAAFVVTPGQSATTTLNVSRQSAFAGNVQFALEGAPAGVTATITPNPATAGTSTVTINTATTTTPGTYQLTLRGTSAGATERTAVVTLIVAAP